MSTINGSCSEGLASHPALKALQAQLQSQRLEQQKTELTPKPLQSDASATDTPSSQQESNTPAPGTSTGSIINTFA